MITTLSSRVCLLLSFRPFAGNTAAFPDTHPGFTSLYDSGGYGVLALVPPVPLRPEDQILRAGIPEFFSGLALLIHSVIEEDAEFEDVEDMLMKAIYQLPAGKKLRRRLTYRLADVKIACAYCKQVKGRRYRLRSYQRDLAVIEEELRRLGELC